MEIHCSLFCTVLIKIEAFQDAIYRRSTIRLKVTFYGVTLLIPVVVYREYIIAHDLRSACFCAYFSNKVVCLSDTVVIHTTL